jgi:CHAD domain-containing protein
MQKQQFYRRWKRRFLAGLAESQRLLEACLRTGDPEMVHDLRVTLRRARVLALVGTPVLGKTQTTHFRQWALKVATALGRVRDSDVTLQWLNSHCPSPARERTLRQDRARMWRSTRPKLAALSAMRWKQLRQWDHAAIRPRKLRKKFLKECLRLRQALHRDSARFHHLDDAALHEFRRGLRRLRYLRELALSRKEQKSDRKLEGLVGFQEALGEMQNCSLARGFFSHHTRLRPDAKALELAKAQEARWLKRAERHLKAYVRQTES